MAEPFQMREDRHARLGLHPRHKALAAARHDHVDGAVKALEHFADGGAVIDRHELDAFGGKPRIDQALDKAFVNRR